MRGFSKLLPALTALISVSASSAIALSHHNPTAPPPNPHPASQLTPKLCNSFGLAGDASAVFVHVPPSIGGGMGLQLQTATFAGPPGGDVPYGDLRNPSNPEFSTLQFDVSGLDGSFSFYVSIVGQDPITGLNDEAFFLPDLLTPAPTQPGHGFTRYIITAAMCNINGASAGPPEWVIGEAFRRAALGIFPNVLAPETNTVANVVLNSIPPAQAILVTPTNDCQDSV